MPVRIDGRAAKCDIRIKNRTARRQETMSDNLGLSDIIHLFAQVREQMGWMSSISRPRMPVVFLGPLTASLYRTA